MINDDDSLNGHHFVLLDEDRFTAQMIQTLLPTLGEVTFEIHQNIDDVVAALEKAADAGPIVLVDLDGEHHRGLTLLKQIRTGESGLPRGLPVLALAGQSDQSLVLKAQELDVGAVLARPLSRAALHASCRRLGAGGIEPRPIEAYQGVGLPAR